MALAPGGVFVIEAHYLVDMLEQGAFDTIYHEHVSYWALGPMIRLFAQDGMEIVNVERLPLHHGQIRVAVQRKGEGRVQRKRRRDAGAWSGRWGSISLTPTSDLPNKRNSSSAICT